MKPYHFIIPKGFSLYKNSSIIYQTHVFKNNKTLDNVTPVINRWINNLDSHKIHRVFTNCIVLAAAREYVYSKSQDDIKESNKYIRGFKNPFIHKTYDPYIQSFRDHKPKI